MVVVWPAMGVPARYYRPLAASLRRAGLAVVVADLRGTGASTPTPGRSSRYGYADLAADVGAVQEALKPRLDGRRRLVLGHSLGGQAALLHLALSSGEADIDGVVLVAVGLPYWRWYPGRRRHGVLAMTQSIGAASAVLGVWPGWGFGGRQARGVMRDWAYTARTGRFPRLDGVDVEAALRQVRTPVLAISVDRDQFTPARDTRSAVRQARVRTADPRTSRDRRRRPFHLVRSAGGIAARVARWAGTVA
jgi:predicted alpha/beta hydrolase